MAKRPFSSSVAARTRAAAFVLRTPDLLAAYEAAGGLAADLSSIVEAGEAAELANLQQSGKEGESVGTSAESSRSFAALQREYKAVMRVLAAVRVDLEEAQAPDAVLAKADAILADEAAVVVRLAKGVDGDKAARRVVKSRSQENIRAEIYRDAEALLGFPEVAAPLTNRKVDTARLTALRDAAVALSGRISDRVATKADIKAATLIEHEAVAAQSRRWPVVQRLLASVEDPRLRGLLRDARG